MFRYYADTYVTLMILMWFSTNIHFSNFVYSNMKLWKILVVFALPYFILGCCKCADYLTVSDYTYCDIQADNIDTTLANSSPYSQADTIDASNYGMRIAINTSQGTCHVPTSFFTSVYACKCPEPYLNRPMDTVIDFKIITLNSYNSLHTAGDTITSYFQQFLGSSYKTTSEFVSSYLSQETRGFNVVPIRFNFDLKLMTPPNATGRHSFRIEMLMSDNRLLTATSKEVFLN